MASNVEYVRLRKKEPPKPAQTFARHSGILQDQLRRAAKRPWNASFSLAVRILLIVRVTSAMYANLQDCDEVYNFWEPLHYLDRGNGFQTWETSPAYAIRSWAYILLHLPAARLPSYLIASDKRISFFAVRIFLGVISTLCEAALYRAVVEKINERVGRYLFFMLLFSAGMWTSATAFLPSSFAMYATMLAFAYAIEPATLRNKRRTLVATVSFATGAIVGWPFALALSVPFVIEELFVLGGDKVLPELKSSWMASRWKNFATSVLAASLIFVPVIGIDSLAYGRFVIVPWNIIRYNIFGGSERGPDLYGTEPWYFYLLNLALNFNVLVPLALIALPALLITHRIDRKRLGFVKPGPDQSSPFALLALRLTPFYIWFIIMSAQAHKEERFMYPAYPLLCFNAAVSLYLIRGWFEVAYIAKTKSPYRASQSQLFRRFTLSVIMTFILLSYSRGMALWKYYHAPQTVTYKFEAIEVPRLLNVTGLLPPPPPDATEDDMPRLDIRPIKEFDLRFCVGKEWYRFPGSYYVPEGVKIDFVKSEFDGMLPGHFAQVPSEVRSTEWFRPGTQVVPSGLNDLNEEDPSHYVPIESCDYFLDLDFPLHPKASPLEPRYIQDIGTWERVGCEPFLDAAHSPTLTRTLWMPGAKWQTENQFGEYCLLKNRASVAEKESIVAARVAQ